MYQRFIVDSDISQYLKEYPLASKVNESDAYISKERISPHEVENNTKVLYDRIEKYNLKKAAEKE